MNGYCKFGDVGEKWHGVIVQKCTCHGPERRTLHELVILSIGFSWV